MQIYYLKLFNLRSFIDVQCTNFLPNTNTLSEKNQTVHKRRAVCSDMCDICKMAEDCKLDFCFSHLSTGKSQSLMSCKILMSS